MRDFLQQIYDFLVTYNFPTLLESIRGLQWEDVLGSAYTWLLGLPAIIFLLWTKRYKLLVTAASFVLLLVLIRYTLPPPGDKIPLSDLLTFIGGSFGLVAVNLYFLFIRD